MADYQEENAIYFTPVLYNQLMQMDGQSVKLYGKIVSIENGRMKMICSENDDKSIVEVQDFNENYELGSKIEIRGICQKNIVQFNECTLLNPEFVHILMKTNNNQQESFDYENYAKKMRLELSNPDIRKEDGSLNHQYFIVKKNQYFDPVKQAALFRGLEVFGVGEWADIKYFEFNNKVNEIELEMRTSILLGVQNLKPYMGKRLNKNDIEKEYEMNMTKGTQLKKIQNGLYNNM